MASISERDTQNIGHLKRNVYELNKRIKELAEAGFKVELDTIGVATIGIKHEYPQLGVKVLEVKEL